MGLAHPLTVAPSGADFPATRRPTARDNLSADAWPDKSMSSPSDSSLFCPLSASRRPNRGLTTDRSVAGIGRHKGRRCGPASAGSFRVLITRGSPRSRNRHAPPGTRHGFVTRSAAGPQVARLGCFTAITAGALSPIPPEAAPVESRLHQCREPYAASGPASAASFRVSRHAPIPLSPTGTTVAVRQSSRADRYPGNPLGIWSHRDIGP